MARCVNQSCFFFKIKMSDRNFTQRFDVFMTSLSSDNKITGKLDLRNAVLNLA